MGTAKRERQKANRQARLEQLAKEARQQKTRKRTFTIGGAVIGAVVVLFVLARLAGGGDDDSSTDTTLPSTATTIASETSTAPTDTSDLGTATTAATETTEAASTTEATTTTVAFAYGDAPCPADDGSTALPDTFEGAPKLCIDPSKTYTAEVVTNKGSFTMELNTEGAPGNVNNFVVLARYGYYDGSVCHRIMKDFVVQCGRPDLDDTEAAEKAPGYTVGDELPAAGEYAEGVVAMANTGSPDTGGGQWFIITGDQGASLDPNYTILGTVTKGLNSTVQALENLADPTASNGVPTLAKVVIESVTITES
ncbi:MAG: peptidylprolyl isomerase [Acidimicrobiales bacterium]